MRAAQHGKPGRWDQPTPIRRASTGDATTYRIDGDVNKCDFTGDGQRRRALPLTASCGTLSGYGTSSTCSRHNNGTDSDGNAISVCRWSSLAQIGGTSGWLNGVAQNFRAHELGHNCCRRTRSYAASGVFV